MPGVDENRAAFYFRCLTASNSHAELRQELALAGVAEHTIDQLYPLTFAEIAPSIERHLSHLPADHLRQGADWQWRVTPEALREKIGESATDDQKRRHVQAYLAEAPTLTADARVQTLFTALHRAGRGGSSGRSVDIYNALYWAWWFMTYRSEYPIQAQSTIDSLMLWVAEHVLFDIHLMLTDAGVDA